MASLKTLRKLGVLYLALSLSLTTAFIITPSLVKRIFTPAHFSTEAHQWFLEVKPFCNQLELETKLKNKPPPSGWLGTAYKATCYTLAGDIEKAEQNINSLDKDLRYKAAGVLFDIGHPIADQGDDLSAGNIMSLVVTYQPENYMAQYHAGMAEYLNNKPIVAKKYLERFLKTYNRNDYWTSNAKKVLDSISTGKKLPDKQVRTFVSH